MSLRTSMPCAAPRKPGLQRLTPAAHVTLSHGAAGSFDILAVDLAVDLAGDLSVERVQEPALEVFALGPVQ